MNDSTVMTIDYLTQIFAWRNRKAYRFNASSYLSHKDNLHTLSTSSFLTSFNVVAKQMSGIDFGQSQWARKKQRVV